MAEEVIHFVNMLHVDGIIVKGTPLESPQGIPALRATVF